MNNVLNNKLLIILKEIIENKGVKVILKDELLNYQGFYDKGVIILGLKTIDKESKFMYNRYGIIGDLFETKTHIIIKDSEEEDLLLIGTLAVLLHEYNHYNQDLKGKLIMLEDEEYVSELEYEANIYSAEKTKLIYNLYKNNNTDLIKEII